VELSINTDDFNIQINTDSLTVISKKTISYLNKLCKILFTNTNNQQP